MSRIILISLVAVAILLAGATAVYAQTNTNGMWRHMSQIQTTGSGTSTNGIPADLAAKMNEYMANAGGIMGSTDMQAAHQAMLNGDWNAMRDACQKAWESNPGVTRGTQSSPQSSQSTPSGQNRPSTGRGSMMGGRSAT